ncbi:MAG: NAD-binding protein [bacterium]|nr:NAD-binding protein [bacterium]
MTIFINFYKRILQFKQHYSRSELIRLLMAIILLAIIGATIYSRIEGWTFLDALYATVITMTTVGYGDVAPRTPEGRTFAIFFTLFAIGIAGYAISTLAANMIENRHQRIANRLRKRLMTRISALHDHYILCGADLLGLRIAEEFSLQKAMYIVIDDDEARLKNALLYTHPEYFQQKIRTLTDFHDVDLSEYEDLTLAELSEKMNIPYILADPTDDTALVKARIEYAKGLIATRPDDRDNLSIVIGARNLAKRANNDALKIMTRANDPNNLRKLYLAGADFVRIPHIVSGMEMASHMLHPEIGNWWYSRTGAGADRRGMFVQDDMSRHPHWLGVTVGKVYEAFGVMIVSVKRGGEFISPPPYDMVLKNDDIVIMVG